jgi:phosphatidyl-myo-inositol dimannoside synthase
MRPRLQLSATRLDLAASGIGRVARLMARVVADEGIDARLLSLSPGPKQLFGLRVRHAAGNQPVFLALNALAALRARAFLYDFAGVARAHPPRPLAAPYLTWMHGIEVWENARRDHLERLRAADVLLVNSHYTLERASKLHRGLEHAHVCWLATETDDPAAAPLEDHPPSVMILGRIDASEAYKGHCELIEAWPAVRKRVPDAQLLIAGDGSGRQALQQLARRHAPGSGIEFLGFVPDDALPALFRRTHVLAMPSRGEGFGLTYIEAMRCGIPVVASIHDAAPEINLHGVTGLNVDLDDPRALPSALADLLHDRDHARRLGSAGRQRWVEHFRYARFRERFAAHLRALVS